MELALELSGNGKMLLQSVYDPAPCPFGAHMTNILRQTQGIDPRYLSTDAKSGRRLDRKTDLTYSYSHEEDGLAALYARLLPRISAVSHMSDAFTKTTALFSGIEVKPADGDKSEAEYQISIFMGASLRKKAELARMAGLSDTASALIEPAFVVVSHEWYFYLAYLHCDGAVHVLEHGSCSTSSISGVFKILRVLRNVVKYGLEGLKKGELKAKVGYWGSFLGPVLERLAGGTEMARGIASAATLRDEGSYMILSNIPRVRVRDRNKHLKPLSFLNLGISIPSIETEYRIYHRNASILILPFSVVHRSPTRSVFLHSELEIMVTSFSPPCDRSKVSLIHMFGLLRIICTARLSMSGFAALFAGVISPTAWRTSHRSEKIKYI
jgi:hypothetical protein